MVIRKGNNPRSWRTENQPHLVYSHILTDLGWSSATASSPRQNHWHQQDLCVVFSGWLLKGRYWGNLKKNNLTWARGWAIFLLFISCYRVGDGPNVSTSASRVVRVQNKNLTSCDAEQMFTLLTSYLLITPHKRNHIFEQWKTTPPPFHSIQPWLINHTKSWLHPWNLTWRWKITIFIGNTSAFMEDFPASHVRFSGVYTPAISKKTNRTEHKTVNLSSHKSNIFNPKTTV